MAHWNANWTIMWLHAVFSCNCFSCSDVQYCYCIVLHCIAPTFTCKCSHLLSSLPQRRDLELFAFSNCVTSLCFVCSPCKKRIRTSLKTSLFMLMAMKVKNECYPSLVRPPCFINACKYGSLWSFAHQRVTANSSKIISMKQVGRRKWMQFVRFARKCSYILSKVIGAVPFGWNNDLNLLRWMRQPFFVQHVRGTSATRQTVAIHRNSLTVMLWRKICMWQ